MHITKNNKYTIIALRVYHDIFIYVYCYRLLSHCTFTEYYSQNSTKTQDVAVAYNILCAVQFVFMVSCCGFELSAKVLATVL